MQPKLPFDVLHGFFQHIHSLKHLPRSGWALRGVEKAESVAAHSWSMAMLVMILAPRVGVNTETALKIALLHDFAESIVGDVNPYDDVSPEEKKAQEETAMQTILKGLPEADQLLSLFYDYRDGRTPEARLVKVIDKLDMAFQAFCYGRDHEADFTELFDSASKRMTEQPYAGWLADIREAYAHAKAA